MTEQVDMVGGAKRKDETLAVKASKAAKVDLKNLKNNTKEQLISKLQTLQSENEVLREHNETKTEKIEELERKMEIMQHLEKISVCVQTEDMNRMFCVECEYPAEDIFDLGEHMYEVHAELNDVYSIACHHCGNYFKNKIQIVEEILDGEN